MEPGACVWFGPVYKLVCNREVAIQFTRSEIKSSGRVGDCVVPVISGNFLLCKLRANIFKKTSARVFH